VLTKIVAIGNIVKTLIGGNEMTVTKGFEPWYIFTGTQTAMTNSREALAEEIGDDATIVLGGREYFYAKFTQKYFDSARQIAKDSGARVDHCTEPGYATAYCGKLSAAVAKHQYACHACKDIKNKNTAWSKETLENEVAKTTTHLSPDEVLTVWSPTPDVKDATAMLTSFISMAESHREEHRTFATKWNDYVTSLRSLQTDIQESSRQLKEAQIRFDKNTAHIAALLQTGEDD